MDMTISLKVVLIILFYLQSSRFFFFFSYVDSIKFFIQGGNSCKRPEFHNVFFS